MGKVKFKKHVLKVKTIGLKAYCETEFGQYREECMAIDDYGYNHKYADWAKKEEKWGFTALGINNENGATYVVKLPDISDKGSIVNLVASLALSALLYTNKEGINVPMVGRVSEVIYNSLMYETIEEE